MSELPQPKVVIEAAVHEGISVTVGGLPAMLAVVRSDGTVVASGDQVARETAAAAVHSYREFLKGRGFLKTRTALRPLPTNVA